MYFLGMQMCRISLSDLKDNTNVEEIKSTVVHILPFEKTLHSIFSSEQKDFSRIGTIDILEYMQAMFKGLEVTLVLGSDTYKDLVENKWKRSLDIMKIAKLYVQHHSLTFVLSLSLSLYIFFYQSLS